ncbi:hypothetical protein [Amycolatopsis sp. PS_44_ISF1]|uniref:hypothetical protein n=1 Tax=Amycolatopsis sp. PS_44_ISF1 TaxID=2974917 RepID=UPI0028E094AE|nr:hypothetical protein [Amycolatopsis sp. PS_44_ISF1]MDT8912985.1 hypothetical protein [Amycolatopsis sp. PS_44_ISF1]
MSNEQYTTFLLIGVLAVLVDGQILYRGGRRYLSGARGDSEADGSMGRMVAVVFHLVCLGLLALLSVVNLGGSGTAAVVAKIGLFLLLMAVAHAITLSVLGRQRESTALESRIGRQRPAPVDERLQQPGPGVRVSPVQPDGSYPGAPVDPVPGQPGVAPQVSPDLEQRGPYTT